MQRLCPNCDCLMQIEAIEDSECITNAGDIYPTLDVTWYCPCCNLLLFESDCPEEFEEPSDCPECPEPEVSDTMPYAMMAERQNANVAAGTFAAGDWRRRMINSYGESHNLTVQLLGTPTPTGELTIVEPFAIYPNAGTYLIRWSAPAFATLRHQTRLRIGISSGVDTQSYSYVYGTSEVSNTTNASQTRSFGVAKVQLQTIVGQNARGVWLALEHRCGTTRTTDGFGLAANVGSDYEQYAVLEIWKVGTV